MKKLVSIILVISIVFSALALGAEAVDTVGTTYYVSSSEGNDSNSGTSESAPLKTLGKVSSMTFSAGDKILFKSGDVFIGTFLCKGNGTEENPIEVSSYGGEVKPILTTQEEKSAVISITDYSNWKVNNLEITAPYSNGVKIYFIYKVVKNIYLENLTIHDVCNTPSTGYDASSKCAVRIDGWGTSQGAHHENIFVTYCEIYNCGYGIHTSGNYPDTVENPRNKNIIVDSCSIHDICDDAFIMARSNTIVIRNSSVIRACQSSGLYSTAPVWMWGVTNGLVENCEIAGSVNELDGMTVDFDDHTDHSTYQYIYSHDNTRFMWNCPYDDDDHFYNTVRYCLSVNDGSMHNGGTSFGTPEHFFKFYNNTIIGSGTFNFMRYDESTIMNNIFMPDFGSVVRFNPINNFYLGSNCYYNTIIPLMDGSSMYANPQFAGTDYSDINSFRLKKVSKLIGKGVQVEENMGEHDFFGNPLDDTHNIGCYEGDGTEGKKSYANIFASVGKVASFIIVFVYKELKNDIIFGLNMLEQYQKNK